LATHLTEICRRHADELLTRDATKHLLQELKQTSPATVEELIPGLMSLAEVQSVLHLLLREQVSLKQLGLILEALGDFAPKSKDPILLTEYVRHRLARQITARYSDADNQLHAVTLAPSLEDRIQNGFELRESGLVLRLSTQEQESICRHIRQAVEKLTARNLAPIVLVSPQIRPAARQMTANKWPELIVLSTNEVTRDTKVKTYGSVPENGPAAPLRESYDVTLACAAGSH
jgi:flagellar biosynthesis protein FlhA